MSAVDEVLAEVEAVIEQFIIAGLGGLEAKRPDLAAEVAGILGEAFGRLEAILNRADEDLDEDTVRRLVADFLWQLASPPERLQRRFACRARGRRPERR